MTIMRVHAAGLSNGAFIENYRGHGIYYKFPGYGGDGQEGIYSTLAEARQAIDNEIEEADKRQNEERQNKVDSGKYGTFVKQDDGTYNVYAPGASEPVATGWDKQKCRSSMFDLEDQYNAEFIWVA